MESTCDPEFIVWKNQGKGHKRLRGKIFSTFIMLSIIGLYGFFNRWNDTLATPLEDGPKAFAEKAIGKAGWTPGKHEA